MLFSGLGISGTNRHKQLSVYSQITLTNVVLAVGRGAYFGNYLSLFFRFCRYSTRSPSLPSILEERKGKSLRHALYDDSLRAVQHKCLLP